MMQSPVSRDANRTNPRNPFIEVAKRLRDKHVFALNKKHTNTALVILNTAIGSSEAAVDARTNPYDRSGVLFKPNARSDFSVVLNVLKSYRK